MPLTSQLSLPLNVILLGEQDVSVLSAVVLTAKQMWVVTVWERRIRTYLLLWQHLQLKYFGGLKALGRSQLVPAHWKRLLKKCEIHNQETWHNIPYQNRFLKRTIKTPFSPLPFASLATFAYIFIPLVISCILCPSERISMTLTKLHNTPVNTILIMKIAKWRLKLLFTQVKHRSSLEFSIQRCLHVFSHLKFLIWAQLQFLL